MQKRRKSRWEIIVVAIAALFFAVCVTAAGFASPVKGHKAQRTYTEPSILQATVTEPVFAPQVTATPMTTQDSIIMSRDWGAEDADILLRIAMAEAEGEDTKGKALVMLVVLNRVWSDGFPDTVEDVVFQTLGGNYQFSPVAPGGRYWTKIPDEDCRAALQMIENGWDESMGALYFEACAGASWQSENCEYLFSYGGHNFYK